MMFPRMCFNRLTIGVYQTYIELNVYLIPCTCTVHVRVDSAVLNTTMETTTQLSEYRSTNYTLSI